MSYIPETTRLERAILVVFALLLTIGIGVNAVRTDPKLASPFVLVDMGNGHGSGTVLDGGIVLTAGHVTNNGKAFTIRTEDGQVIDGSLLWQNTAYDVGIIDIGRNDKVGSAPLSCKPNYVGQNITIVGNPLSTVFAKSWGKVSGLGKTGLENIYGEGMWKELVTLDITAAPGVSGAGVMNDAGEIVGILVAGAVSDRGTFRYSYMVPATLICKLLGRS